MSSDYHARVRFPPIPAAGDLAAAFDPKLTLADRLPSAQTGHCGIDSGKRYEPAFDHPIQEPLMHRRCVDRRGVAARL